MPLGVWSEFAPGSCPSVVRRVAHWVEHYRVGPVVMSGGRLRAGGRGGGGADGASGWAAGDEGWGLGGGARGEWGPDEAHCWVSETAPSGPCGGSGLFLMALIPDVLAVWWVWVGSVCVV